MNNEYNLSILEALFTDHLHAENISKVSAKNYRSDIKLFTSWFYTVSKGLIDHSSAEYTQPSYIEVFIVTSSKELIEDFKRYLLDSHVPIKTINRRLSAIRRFYAFCVKRGVLSSNPTVTVANVIYSKPASSITPLKPLIPDTAERVDDFRVYISDKIGIEIQAETLSEYDEYIKLWS